MKWVLDTNTVDGLINFEMNLKDTMDLFGEPDSTFKRTIDSEGTVFAYDKFDIQVEFNDANQINEIIVFSKNEVFIEDVQVLGLEVKSAKRALNSKLISVIKEDAGLWCEEYRALLIDIDDKVVGVEIYKD